MGWRAKAFFADLGKLRQLRELRGGKNPAAVTRVERRNGRADVFQAPQGEFVERDDGRFDYRDELGQTWTKEQHDRWRDTLNRQPYGHRVELDDRTADGAPMTRIAYLRPPLEPPLYDERKRRRDQGERGGR